MGWEQHEKPELGALETYKNPLDFGGMSPPFLKDNMSNDKNSGNA